MMETPEIVEKLTRLISEKLGREAINRKIKNRNEYFILDLAFSYFQKADRNKRNDYRSGYLYLRRDEKDYLLFVIAHSPIMISFFSNNFDYNLFRDIVNTTSIYRDEHFLRYSKSKIDKGIIKAKSISDFLVSLDKIENKDFVNTIFTKPTTKDSKTGNIFVLRLAEDLKNADIRDIIDKSWDLFLWLYPSKPLFQRNASLNRSLLKIQRRCEIDNIENLPDNISKTNCSGQIEGAHIIPHKDGGSDKLENGIWLCNLHHRLTEDKLIGKRNFERIEVKYKQK